MASAEALSATLTDVVWLSEQPVADLGAGEGPLASALPQLGGFNCFWSNGAPEYAEDGNPNPDHVALHVMLLPDATADDRQGMAGGMPGCGHFGGTVDCRAEQMIDGHWVVVSATGVRSDEGTTDAAMAAFDSLLEEITTTVSASAVHIRPWSPPAETIPLTGECEQIVDDSTVNGIYGTTTPLVVGRSGGGWSLEAASWARLDAMPCHILFEGLDSAVGFFTWLPGGDWAFPAAEADAEVDAAGLQGDDRLLVECEPTPSGQMCSADLAVGHNWVRINTYDADEDTPPGHDYAIAPRDSAVALAEAVVARLRG